MQRKLTKKLSGTLQQQEEDDYRHQFPIPQLPQQYARPPPPIKDPPSYGSDNESPSRSNSSDDLSDDVSLEYIPEQCHVSDYADDPSTSYDRDRDHACDRDPDRDKDRDRDRDYRSRSSPTPPARINSRDRERERDDPPITLKGKESSKSFLLPLKKLSKSKSSVKDSDIYASSGSRSSRSSFEGSRSNTSRPQSRSSSQVSLSGSHRGQSSRKHSSTRVPGGHSPSRRGSSSNSSSREVMALPIDIPESVPDEDAFRRYLSVRRGGIDLEGIPTTSSVGALIDDEKKNAN